MVSSNLPDSELDVERVRSEASVWLAVLRSSERSPEMEATFEAWLDEDAAHHRAFFAITRTWQLLGAAGAQLRADQRRKKLHRQRLVGAMAACLVVAVGVPAWFAAFPVQHLETQHGELRTVVLSDGSRVTLNTGTRMAVRYMFNRRSIKLEKGEAAFDVAHDKRRPFVVSADGEDIAALGTSFIVRTLAEGQLGVTLTEGRLKLTRSAAGPKAEPIVLTAGQGWTPRGGVRQLASSDLEQAAAWRRGEVVFNNTSLSAAVTEMNRYGGKPLYLDVSQADEFKISGVFRIEDGDAFAKTLAALYGLTVEERGQGLHILGRPQRPGTQGPTNR